MRYMTPGRRIFIGALFLTAFSAATNGAIVSVFNTNDNLAGSLRQAIQDASNGDTIVFQIPMSDPRYLASAGIYFIDLTSGSLVINKNLILDTQGQKVWVERATASPFSVFRIPSATVRMQGLTISSGYSSGGGGIDNTGNLTVIGCTFRNNIATASGGAITNGGTLRISNCTFYGNSCPGGSGSAILNAGAAWIDNTTITYNSNGNTGGAPAAALNNNGFGGTMRVRNTIIVGNTATSSIPGSDVAGPFISEGYNLVGFYSGASASGFGATGDQIGATPEQANLGGLTDHGGPTYTVRPLAGSVAIDQGKRGLDANNLPINIDQRGFVRPYDLAGVPNAVGGDGSDIGAYETGAGQAGPAFTVTNTTQNDGDGCTMDDCSLREAIGAANANPDASKIFFAPNVTGQIRDDFLFINTPIAIYGPGARVLGIYGRTVTIFNVASGVSATISGLTIAEGQAPYIDGGAILNRGTLTLRDCTVRDCIAFYDTSQGGGNGGGIMNMSGATLNLERCTFANNVAQAFGGGAIFNAGSINATNCTFYSNSAPAGGAILSLSNNVSTLRNCTITNNTATDTSASTSGGGGYYGQGAAGNALHHFSNTILAGNINSVNPDLRGYGTSEGNNIIGNLGAIGGGFSNGVNGDKVGVAANLGAFANNGGATDTVALQSNSPAINMGNNTAPTTDQRGYLRSGVVDIGAFEFNGVSPSPVSLTSVVSRKVHASAGTFDVNLPLAGGGLEPRSASGIHTIIFNFSNTLTDVGSAAISSGIGNVTNAQIGANAHQYVIDLSGVLDAQRVTLRLTNVIDSSGNNSSTQSITFGALVGDVSGNGTVNSSDVSQVKLQSGQPVTGSNFRNDVNGNGSINASDVSSVKLRSGTALPP
jgi:hypothetical protein